MIVTDAACLSDFSRLVNYYFPRSRQSFVISLLVGPGNFLNPLILRTNYHLLESFLPVVIAGRMLRSGIRGAFTWWLACS